MQSIIESGLQELSLSPAPAAALARYGELLLEQNRVMNLTAITEPEQVARLHMLDSAAVLRTADFSGCSVLDVGTGAGFPGLVLKLCEPTIQLTLLDSLDKRVQWLSRIAPELGAPDIRCVHGRAEELAREPDWREQFDIVTSRAVAELRILCELCLPFVKPGGVFLAMKADDSAAEVDAAGRAISILGGRLKTACVYELPGTKIRRKVIRVEKIASTPEKYPRRYAKMRKSPL